MFGAARRRLMGRVDADRVRDAVRRAETRTSGEIRVSLAPFFWGSVRRTAERAFERLGMTATRDRNGVLFFLVPSRRKFVVLGDRGIHEKVGQEFWDDIAAAVSDHFRKGEFTEGLEHGILEAGEVLARHFPYDAATDKNELPDEIDFGKK